MFRLRPLLRYARVASRYTSARFASKQVHFPGAPMSQYTEELKVDRDWPVLPTYRVMDTDGVVVNSSQEPDVILIK
jgi:2-oxoisovalerate dehydrogenase E1 component alpha subunit